MFVSGHVSVGTQTWSSRRAASAPNCHVSLQYCQAIFYHEKNHILQPEMMMHVFSPMFMDPQTLYMNSR